MKWDEAPKPDIQAAESTHFYLRGLQDG